MKLVKKQGFIIRKARRIEVESPPQSQQRKYMSQTHFLRKTAPIPILRSPGQIIHLRNKHAQVADPRYRKDSDSNPESDHNNINQHSHQHNNHNNLIDVQYSSQRNDNVHSYNHSDRDHDRNIVEDGQNNGRYQFQESPTDLKQIGESVEIGGGIERSFEEIQEIDCVATKGQINIEEHIKSAKIIKKLYSQILQNPCQPQILSTTKSYIHHIQQTPNFTYLPYFPYPPYLPYVLNIPNTPKLCQHNKKILKTSLITENLSIILTGLAEVVGKFEEFRKFIINLIAYSYQNVLLRLVVFTRGKSKAVVELLREEKKQRFLNLGFLEIKRNNDVMLEGIIRIANLERSFYQIFKKFLRQNKNTDPSTHFRTIRQLIAYFLCQTNQTLIAPYLSTCPCPYLPPQQFPRYTLVIDILSCLLTRNRKSTQTFRPFAEYFLDEMSQYYEIVSYCDVLPGDANRVIDALDRKKNIKYRLYRHHICKESGRQGENGAEQEEGKCLGRLGRQMGEIVMIDTTRAKDCMNTIVVSPWRGKKTDAELAQLCPILAMIALKKLNTQKSIKRINQKNQQNKKMGLKHLNYGINFQ